MDQVTLLIGQAAQSEPNFLMAIVPWLLVLGIFYFLLIRPQQKQATEHKAMLDSLQQGDQIVTSGGIHGKISEVGPKVFTVEIAERVKVRINRENVVGRFVPDVQVVENTKKS